MNDFLTFRKMITPIIIQIIFWLGVVVCVLGGLGILFSGDSEYLSGIVVIIFGPFVVRIFCELLIVLFKILDSLREIANNTSPAPQQPQ